MWVRFVEGFVWAPPERKGRVSLVFQSGSVLFVRRACGEAAIAAGKAVPSEPQRVRACQPVSFVNGLRSIKDQS